MAYRFTDALAVYGGWGWHLFRVINPLWPDAQPYDTVFFVLVALASVWVSRDTMFTRSRAATEVTPAASASPS